MNTTERPRPFRRGILAALLAGAVFFSSVSAQVDVKTELSVKSFGDNTGCVISATSASGNTFQLVRWRVFKNGVSWKSSKGPWTPQAKYYCGVIGITKTIQGQGDYVLFDSNFWSNRCMPLLKACP